MVYLFNECKGNANFGNTQEKWEKYFFSCAKNFFLLALLSVVLFVVVLKRGDFFLINHSFSFCVVFIVLLLIAICAYV